MASQTVWLALAGDMVEPGEVLDHHATKCGGAPLYPGTRPPLGAADACCRVCGAALSLVLQVSWQHMRHDTRGELMRKSGCAKMCLMGEE